MNAKTTTTGRTTIVTVHPARGSVCEQLGVVGEGQAKCRHQDFFNAETGYIIALGRAVQDMGKNIENLGHERVVSKTDLARAMRELSIVAVLTEKDVIEL